MTKFTNQFLFGAALGIMVFVRGIVGSFMMVSAPVVWVPLASGMFDLVIVGFLYSIISLMRGAGLSMFPDIRSRVATLILVIVCWMTFPIIGAAPKAIAMGFPDIAAFTSGGIFGHVLVIGTLAMAGIICSSLVAFACSFLISAIGDKDKA